MKLSTSGSRDIKNIPLLISLGTKKYSYQTLLATLVVAWYKYFLALVRLVVEYFLYHSTRRLIILHHFYHATFHILRDTCRKGTCLPIFSFLEKKMTSMWQEEQQRITRDSLDRKFGGWSERRGTYSALL